MTVPATTLVLAALALLGPGCSRSPGAQASSGQRATAESRRATAAPRGATGRTRDAPPRLGQGIVRSASGERWRLALEHPASELHVTPEGDVVAVGPDRITVVDPQGQPRWHRNIAPGDRLLPSGSCLFVHLSRGTLVSAFDALGQPSWERYVEGSLEPLGDGSLLAIDAAAVRSIACDDGTERWMFSPDRIRSLRFLSAAVDSLALLGELGQRRVLFDVGHDGQVRSSTELPHQSDAVTIVSSDRVLARTATTVVAVDRTGRELWSSPVSTRTQVGVHRGAVILVDDTTDGEVVARILGSGGQVQATCTAEVGGEPVSLKILGSDRFPLLFAACAGALSACAERGLATGAFNRLWTCSTDDGAVATLVDQSSDLSFDIGQSAAQTVVVATSEAEQSTRVIQLDQELRQTLLATLPERLMTGPVAAPNGSWLVATCQGTQCGEPWTLLDVDGQE